jgi:hypothetical protein
MKTEQEKYKFIKTHLEDAIKEFVVYKKLDKELSEQIYFAIQDIIDDAFGKL